MANAGFTPSDPHFILIGRIKASFRQSERRETLTCQPYHMLAWRFNLKQILTTPNYVCYEKLTVIIHQKLINL